jgi:tetratricopeptide (TPR) repeat protein
MPTHIYTRLGEWQQSIDLNLRSAAAAWRLPVNGQISGHYFHALDYLAYAYLQQSEYEKVENMIASIDTLSAPFQPHTATLYALAAIKARLALEYERWTDAANLVLEYEPKLPWEKFPQYEALVYFAKGIGGGRSGNPEIAKLSFEKLESLKNALGDSRASLYWKDQIEVQKTVVKAWQMYAEKDLEKTKEIMFLAAELEDATEKNPVTPGELLPVREMLGDLLLEMGQPEEALLQFEHALQRSPNRFNSLYGAGKSAEMIGDKNKARDYFTILLEISKNSGLNRDQLVEASNYINEI